jgi:hypothetical protein
MTEPQQPDPEPPTPPGTADRDVDLPIDPGGEPMTPGNEDVAPETGATEPPD